MLLHSQVELQVSVQPTSQHAYLSCAHPPHLCLLVVPLRQGCPELLTQHKFLTCNQFYSWIFTEAILGMCSTWESQQQPSQCRNMGYLCARGRVSVRGGHHGLSWEGFVWGGR